jgi:hypothetical protein
LSTSTYVVLTIWDHESNYQECQKSEAFFNGDKNIAPGFDGQYKTFATVPYTTKYTIPTES